jgi:orotate phosphoribosyltransferase
MEILQQLFEKNIIQFNFEEYYTYSSGMRSPIYLDLRKAVSDPQIRSLLIDLFNQKFKKQLYNFPNRDYQNAPVIVGTPYAAISWGALIAHTNNLPFLYLRKEAKQYGKNQLIEGNLSLLSPGREIIIMEDVVTTGSSALDVITKIKNKISTPTVDQPSGYSQIKDSQFKILSLFNYNLKNNLPYDFDFLIGFNEIFNYVKNCSTMSQLNAQRLKEWNHTNRIT